jgi:hypothetical protein
VEFVNRCPQFLQSFKTVWGFQVSGMEFFEFESVEKEIPAALMI